MNAKHKIGAALASVALVVTMGQAIASPALAAPSTGAVAAHSIQPKMGPCIQKPGSFLLCWGLWVTGNSCYNIRC